MGERHVPGEQLSAFLDDELDDDHATAVARHVTGCERCLGDLEGLRVTRAALRGLPRLQAPVLTTGVEPRRRPTRRARVAAMVCAVPVLLAGVAYAVGGDRSGEVVPPVEQFLVEHVARGGGAPVPPSVLAPPPADPAP
jgi:anti-sigma factor RsiW